MIANRFRSVWMVAGVAGAALACYLVSQRVAAERAELAKVERQIAATQHDIRALSTEIVTRTRLPQLERWNVAVLGLTAPGAGQFLDSEVRLASLNGGPATALPTDPAIGHGAVQTVAFQPAKPLPAPAAPQPVAAEPAPAPQPLLRQATFVRPSPSALAPAAQPIKTSVVVAKATASAPQAKSLSLLPSDIGSLAARERGATERR